MKKKVIFSAIQPTGNFHIGNYLGALRHWVDLQNSGTYQCFFSVVDYHALTGNQSAKERRHQIIQTAIELLSIGIDPTRSTLFVQSHVPEHTELAWIFSTVTPMTSLERMTQFKDKANDQKKNVNAGLFTYPVLQAADILLYHGTHVPVGEDQVQHVELTRDIARVFHTRYGKCFPEIKVLLTETPRIKSLLHPTKKMSKSHGTGSVIELADDGATIRKKLKRAVTATEGGSKAPGAENLLLMLKAFAPKKIYTTFQKAEKAGDIRYGDLKETLAQHIEEHFELFRERRAAYIKRPSDVADILLDGAHRAGLVAQQTISKVRSLVGVR